MEEIISRSITIPAKLDHRIVKLANGKNYDKFLTELLNMAVKELESKQVITWSFGNDTREFIRAIDKNDAEALYKELHPGYTRVINATAATPSDIMRMKALGIKPKSTKSAKLISCPN